MLNNPVEQLRIREEEKRATATLDNATPSRYLALPDNFSKQRDFELIGADERYKLTYVSPKGLRFRQGTGTPCFFTVTTQIEFDIDPDKNYTVEMQYYSSFTALSASNATNTVLTNHPNIYLYGALSHLYNFTKEAEEEAKAKRRFYEAISGANAENNMGRYGSNPYQENLTMVV